MLQHHLITFSVTSSSESLTRCVLLTFTFRNNIFMSGFCLRDTLSTRLCYLNEKENSTHATSLFKKQSATILIVKSPYYLALKTLSQYDSCCSIFQEMESNFFSAADSIYTIFELTCHEVIVQQPFKLPRLLKTYPQDSGDWLVLYLAIQKTHPAREEWIGSGAATLSTEETSCHLSPEESYHQRRQIMSLSKHKRLPRSSTSSVTCECTVASWSSTTT